MNGNVRSFPRLAGMVLASFLLTACTGSDPVSVDPADEPESAPQPGDPPPADPPPPPNYTASAFPKPLPNGWVLGNIAGVAIDTTDHVWVLHRPEAGIGGAYGIGPPVMEFSPDGDLLQAWGGPGPGYYWPASEHGFFVDPEHNVWVTGNSGSDHVMLKFSRSGEFLLQIGTEGVREGSNSETTLGLPADIYVDTLDREVYVADGYGNKRIVVFDSDTGAYKRHWGAFGNVPDDGVSDTSSQWSTPVHCVNVSVDGLVYVCDRQNDRLHVFLKDGTFVQEIYPTLETPTALRGTKPFDVTFTPDINQEYMIVADGTITVPAPPGNDRMLLLRRQTGEELAQIGMAGAAQGQLSAVHAVAIDSQGNLYSGELNGGRVQKWVPDSPPP